MIGLKKLVLNRSCVQMNGSAVLSRDEFCKIMTSYDKNRRDVGDCLNHPLNFIGTLQTITINNG